MDWIPVIVLALVLAYLAAAWYIRRNRIREDIITFYGPIMAIKTRRIGFFDRFRSISTALRVYGSIGIAMVAVVSAIMTILIFIRFPQEIAQPPPAEGIYSPVNWFVIPGVNQFIPFTLPVILGIVITIAIHEFGHGILCRVEGIVVKGMGVLLFVIPIGFFVEPDEEELERTPPVPKARMFGAGIANNLVLGFACFGALILLLGAVTPVAGPVIYMVQENSPAFNASVPLGSVIQTVDGQPVSVVGDVAAILARTKPGDPVNLTVIPAETVRDLPAGAPVPRGTIYSFNLTSAPDRSYGFMGVSYYATDQVASVLHHIGSGQGLLLLTVLPIDILYNQVPPLHLLLTYVPDESFFRVPFPLYWAVVHFLFWCGWFNFMVGTFNALPLVPFDGGFIMKEGVAGLARRLGRPELTDRIVLAVSLVMVAILILIVTIPLIVQALPAIGKAAGGLLAGA
ncbi:MAG TPA: site-2 protease family protein [Methanomicrobiales archaeon]|nr:site-2 protease family protein [Methanomicrobiales archaeon]